MKPITSKKQMYGLLISGALGNTVVQYLSLEEWEASEEAARYPMWGVRTLVPGGPCSLYVPRDEVRAVATRLEFVAAGVNISLMLDAVVGVTLYADVFDTETGLIVYGVENPGKGASWRKVMPEKGREWRGLAARGILRKHLDESSIADVEALLELYPGHVVELSACDKAIGCIPGRRGVVWECRRY